MALKILKPHLDIAQILTALFFESCTEEHQVLDITQNTRRMSSAEKT